MNFSEDQKRMRYEWLSRKHGVFGGDIFPIGDTAIHKGAASLVIRHDMNVYINQSASEPRWEAWGNGGSGFAFDPNLAILKCADDIRMRIGKHS